jgi:hypothetical protein
MLFYICGCADRVGISHQSSASSHEDCSCVSIRCPSCTSVTSRPCRGGVVGGYDTRPRLCVPEKRPLTTAMRPLQGVRVFSDVMPSNCVSPPAFHRNLLPPASGLKCEPSDRAVALTVAVGSCGIYGEQNGLGKFPPSTTVSSANSHSTLIISYNRPHSCRCTERTQPHPTRK